MIRLSFLPLFLIAVSAIFFRSIIVPPEAAVERFIYVLQKKVPGHGGPKHEKVEFFMFQKRRSGGIHLMVDCVVPEGHPVTVKGVNDIDQECNTADDGKCNGKNGSDP